MTALRNVLWEEGRYRGIINDKNNRDLK